jgi:hypothetical protein
MLGKSFLGQSILFVKEYWINEVNDIQSLCCVMCLNTTWLYYDKNMNLKKHSTNFYSDLDLVVYFRQIISRFLTRHLPNFPPDRPEAYPDFFQNFLWVGIRDVT